MALEWNCSRMRVELWLNGSRIHMVGTSACVEKCEMNMNIY